MTELNDQTPDERRAGMRERQDGWYPADVVAEPVGGEVPSWMPPSDGGMPATAEQTEVESQAEDRSD